MAKTFDGPKPKLPDAILEDVQIIYPNFNGRPDDFTREGDRNFTIILSPSVADKMRNDGWNVRERAGREEGDPVQNMMKVKVSFKYKPPQIFQITDRGMNLLPEDLVGILDDADIVKADMILSSNYYDVRGETGFSAYLKSAYITIQEDPLARKYNALYRPVVDHG